MKNLMAMKMVDKQVDIFSRNQLNANAKLQIYGKKAENKVARGDQQAVDVLEKEWKQNTIGAVQW